MKNNLKVRSAAFVLGLMATVGLVGCGGQSSSSAASSVASAAAVSSVVSSVSKFDTSKKITVYTRDTTSGTRDGFFSKIGLSAAKTDNGPLVSGYVEVSSNGTMASSVSNDSYGIGYISLASLASSGLKGLTYEGVQPSEANVKNGSYGLTRNFNYIIRSDYAASSKTGLIAKAFLAFLSTSEAKLTMKTADGIVDITGNEPSWSDLKASYPIASEDNSSITVKFGGSTSVEKMAKALTSQFAPLCGNFIPSHNHTGSGDAYKHTQGSGKDDSGALDVGFLSRELELTSSEPASNGTYGKMATDAIVVVVNQVNTYTASTAATLYGIYTGAKTKWSDVIA